MKVKCKGCGHQYEIMNPSKVWLCPDPECATRNEDDSVEEVAELTPEEK
jgi:hypothetical protein